MNQKALHNRVHTFAKALSKAKKYKDDNFLLRHYTYLAICWSKSDEDKQLIKSFLLSCQTDPKAI